MPKGSINIQDGFLFQSLKSGAEVILELATGGRLTGKLKRFDRFAIVVESGGHEILVYKHGIVSIAAEAPVRPVETEPQE